MRTVQMLRFVVMALALAAFVPALASADHNADPIHPGVHEALPA